MRINLFAHGPFIIARVAAPRARLSVFAIIPIIRLNLTLDEVKTSY